jgi:hypothetical protein
VHAQAIIAAADRGLRELAREGASHERRGGNRRRGHHASCPSTSPRGLALHPHNCVSPSGTRVRRAHTRASESSLTHVAAAVHTAVQSSRRVRCVLRNRCCISHTHGLPVRALLCFCCRVHGGLRRGHTARPPSGARPSSSPCFVATQTRAAIDQWGRKRWSCARRVAAPASGCASSMPPWRPPSGRARVLARCTSASLVSI